MIGKGVTKFDQMCHKVFSGISNGYDYRSYETGDRCNHCCNAIKVYYCEERLYLVECPTCGIKALVAAANPHDAAYKTIGIPFDAEYNTIGTQFEKEEMR